MPRKYSSAGRTNRRHIARKAPTAANQKKQIARNQAQITHIQRRLREIREPVTWTMGFERVTMAPNLPSRGPLVVPLTSGPTVTGTKAALNNTGTTSCQWHYTMTPSIQNAPSNKSKCFLGTQYCDLSIESGTETATQRFTVYLVSLQPDSAQDVYNTTTSMTLLERDIHYCCPDKSGGTDPSFYGAYLNPRAFKIHKKYILHTQTTPSEALSTVARGVGVRNNQYNRLLIKFSYGNTKLQAVGDNAPAGSAVAAASLEDIAYDDIDPHKKRFLVVFSDDTNADVNDATLSLSSIVTGSAA